MVNRHHLAWVEHDGQRSLYVDGRLDALEIAPRPDGAWRLDNTTLGGILRASPPRIGSPVSSMMSPFGVVLFQGMKSTSSRNNRSAIGWKMATHPSRDHKSSLSRHWVQRSHEVGSVVADLSLSSEEALGPVSLNLWKVRDPKATPHLRLKIKN